MDFKDIKGTIESHIVNGTRHPYYKEYCKLADDARAFVTGQGQEVMVREVREGEPDNQKDMRVEVTEPKTPEAISPITTVARKVFRADGITESWGDGFDASAKADIEKSLNTFAGVLTHSQYVEQQQIHYEFNDPNSWLIVDRKDERNKEGRISRTVSYPVEVTSHEAINYKTVNHEPIWLIILREGVEVVDGEVEKVENYFFYSAGKVVVYREYIKTEPSDLGNPKELEIRTITESKGKQRSFVVLGYENGAQEFPGIKWGGYRHMMYDDLTLRMPIYWQGVYQLRSILKKSSLKDVCLWKHIYPKQFIYDSPCTHTSSEGMTCKGGYMNGRKDIKCPSCNGSGSAFHRSEFDAVRILLPPVDDARELMPIDKFIYYAEPPLQVTEFISNDLKEDMTAFFLTVFNSQQEQKVVGTRTATEVMVDGENLNNTCKPFADQNSRIKEKIVRLTAQYKEVYTDEMQYNHSFGKKLGLESESELLTKLDSAKATGVSQDLVNSYEAELFAKRFPEQPDKAANWKALQQHKPFASLPVSSAVMILQERDAEDHDKVKFENWDSITTDVLVSTPNFYQATYKQQEAIIEAHVLTKIEKIKPRKDAIAGPLSFSDMAA